MSSSSLATSATSESIENQKSQIESSLEIERPLNEALDEDEDAEVEIEGDTQVEFELANTDLTQDLNVEYDDENNLDDYEEDDYEEDDDYEEGSFDGDDDEDEDDEDVENLCEEFENKVQISNKSKNETVELTSSLSMVHI